MNNFSALCKMCRARCSVLGHKGSKGPNDGTLTRSVGTFTYIRSHQLSSTGKQSKSSDKPHLDILNSCTSKPATKKSFTRSLIDTSGFLDSFCWRHHFISFYCLFARLLFLATAHVSALDGTASASCKVGQDALWFRSSGFVSLAFLELFASGI